MSSRAADVLLTGLPRSGTNLSCALLNRVPDTIALAEPMDVAELGRMPGKTEAMDRIEDFLDAQRRSLLEQRVGLTRHEGGQVRDNFFSEQVGDDGLRHSHSERGDIVFDKPLSPGFRLVVKHPAAFTALLPELARRFSCFALVRNPLAVLASWNSNRIPVREGRAPAAEAIDPALRASLDAIGERHARQLHLLDWSFGQYLGSLEPQRIIRYESLVASPGAVLQALAPGAETLSDALSSRNTSALYGWDALGELVVRLLDTDGSYWQLYDRDEVARLFRTMRDNRPQP